MLQETPTHITFKLTACNWPVRTETRKVQSVRPDGSVLIHHNHQDGFIVRPHEIIAYHYGDE